MKSIATLAAETNGGKKRKKGEDGEWLERVAKLTSERDDGFGRDDSDWAVYREIVSLFF